MRKRVNGRGRARAVLLVLALVTAVGGCGKDRADVSGMIRYRGKPLTSGTVTFTGSDNQALVGKIDEQGRYTVSGVAPGAAAVSVSSPRPAPPPPVKLPEKVEGAEGPSAAAMRGWFAIPPYYANPNMSRLKFTLNTGDNTIDLDLK